MYHRGSRVVKKQIKELFPTGSYYAIAFSDTEDAELPLTVIKELAFGLRWRAHYIDWDRQIQGACERRWGRLLRVEYQLDGRITHSGYLRSMPLQSIFATERVFGIYRFHGDLKAVWSIFPRDLIETEVPLWIMMREEWVYGSFWRHLVRLRPTPAWDLVTGADIVGGTDCWMSPLPFTRVAQANVERFWTAEDT